MTRSRTPAAGLILLAAGLAACTPEPAPEAPGAVSWPAHLAQLETLSRYRAQGRVASRELDLRADFRLERESPTDYRLRLSGPFGAGAVELIGDDDGVSVHSREGETHTREPEAWIYNRYGWSLPVESLGDWLLGRPSTAHDHGLVLDDAHRAARLVQGGWRVDYLEYREVSGTALPRRLEATNGQVKLTLLVDEWTPLDSPPQDDALPDDALQDAAPNDADV